MQIHNQQTGVTYSTRTHCERGVFVSTVTRRENNTERLTSREKHATRAAAYRYAVTMAKAQAARGHA
jgi:hypothetical protein